MLTSSVQLSTSSSAEERNKISTYAIEAQGLKKRFGNHQALRGIDFTVRRGCVHGFLGPNGAGKTTAIKIMLGLTAADEGQVRVLGEALRFGRKNSFLARVNYLPQDPVFPEGLTGKEALSMVASIYGLGQRTSRSRLQQLLAHFQLEDAANRRVGAYSRGMQQRLGLAAVLMTEPELMILDEPVSALDPDGRRKVLQIITRLKGRATVFFSSHILADVERVCDHVTIIDRGQKLLEADTEHLLRHYAMEQYLVTVKPAQRSEAAAIIGANQAVREVTAQGDRLLVTSHPGEAIAMAEELLPELIRRGIVVTEFTQNRTDLEDVFFRVLEKNRQAGELL